MSNEKKQERKPKAAEGENAPAQAPKAAKAEVVQVTMEDGRVVGFAGKRKMVKNVVEKDGRLAVQFDFRNGQTRLFILTGSPLMHQFAAHGASQKIGDETAGVEELDDMILAVDDIIARLSAGEWGATRAAGDGFAGASVVIRALVEVTGKSVEHIKAFLQKKLDDAKAAGQKLTRNDLYASFRNPTSKTGAVIERLEREKKSKASAVNADDLLGEI